MDYRIIISQDRRVALNCHDVQRYNIDDEMGLFSVNAIMDRTGNEVQLGKYSDLDHAKKILENIAVYLVGDGGYLQFCMPEESDTSEEYYPHESQGSIPKQATASDILKYKTAWEKEGKCKNKIWNKN